MKYFSSMNCSERVVGKEVHDEEETEEEEEGQEEGDRSGSNGILRNGNIWWVVNLFLWNLYV